MGEGSKNHQADSENSEHSGIIPFLDIQTIAIDEDLVLYFNPGTYLEKFINKYLSKDSNFLFQQPKIESRQFDLNNPGTMCLFEANKKIGPKTVQNMMPTVCEIIQEPHQTNHQIRVSVIRALKRAGYSYAEISKITGHRNIITMMENYDPGVDVSEKANMAVAISTAAPLQKGYKFNPISEHLKRKDNGDNLITYNEPKKMVANQMSLDKKIECEDIDDDFSEMTSQEIDVAVELDNDNKTNESISHPFVVNKGKLESSKQLVQNSSDKSRLVMKGCNVSSREALKDRSNKGLDKLNNTQYKATATVTSGMFDKENDIEENISIEGSAKRKGEESVHLESPSKRIKSLKEEFKIFTAHRKSYKEKLRKDNITMTNDDKERWLHGKYSIAKQFLSNPDSSAHDLKRAKEFCDKYENWETVKENEKANTDSGSSKNKEAYSSADLTPFGRENIFKSPSKNKNVTLKIVGLVKKDFKVIDLTKDTEENIESQDNQIKKELDNKDKMELNPTNPKLTQFMNAQDGQNSMINPQCSQNAMMYPQVSQNSMINVMMNPLMNQNAMMNPLMYQNALLNPLMRQNFMMNSLMSPLMCQSAMMNSQVNQMINPNMGYSTMMGQNPMINSQYGQNSQINSLNEAVPTSTQKRSFPGWNLSAGKK